MMVGLRRIRMRQVRNIACELIAALALAWIMVWMGVPPIAHADESDEGTTADNTVNTQQLPDSSFIYDTPIADLSTADTYYDNQTVQVVGEVVGDKIRANSGYCWVTLASDDGNATLSVYMSNEAASIIDTYGQYGVTGTSLQVRGTFHLVCSEHDGATDLHAEVVTVVEGGSEHGDVFEFEKFVPGMVVVVVGLLMMAAFYWMRERRR